MSREWPVWNRRRTALAPPFAVFLGIDVVAALTTSLLVKGPPSVVASYPHFAREDLHMNLAFPLLLGLGTGAQIGPRLSHRISKKRLPKLFGLVLPHAAANVVVNALR